MNKTYRLLLLLCLLLFSLSSAMALTLDETVSLAIKNNPEIQAAKSSWEEARAKIPQTLALSDPEIGLEYEKIPAGSRNLEDGEKMYTAEQMIMFPGKIYADWQMQNNEAEKLKAQYDDKVLAIKNEVKSAYYDFYYNEKSRGIMAEVSALLSQVKNSAQAKYVVGQVTQSDLLQASVEYLQTKNEALIMADEKPVKLARLQALLNQTVATFETKTELKLTMAIGSEDKLLKLALKNNPKLLAMQAEVKMEGSTQLKAKMDFFPDTKIKLKKRVGDGWDAMFAFTLPLYFWKQGYGLAAADLKESATESTLANMRNLIEWELKEAYVMANNQLRTYRLYKTSILPQTEQAWKTTLKAYQVSKVDFQALLITERMYKEAKLKYFASEVNYGKALAELEKITGGEL